MFPIVAAAEINPYRNRYIFNYFATASKIKFLVVLCHPKVEVVYKW